MTLKNYTRLATKRAKNSGKIHIVGELILQKKKKQHVGIVSTKFWITK